MVQKQKKPVVPLTLFFWPLQYEKGGARGRAGKICGFSPTISRKCVVALLAMGVKVIALWVEKDADAVALTRAAFPAGDS